MDAPLAYLSKLTLEKAHVFSVYDESKTAEELDGDLERVRLWVWQWKMKFNTDETEEVIFSAKRVEPFHPPLCLSAMMMW